MGSLHSDDLAIEIKEETPYSPLTPIGVLKKVYTLGKRDNFSIAKQDNVHVQVLSSHNV